MSEILAFNRWSTKNIVVEDPGLVRYIGLEPTIVPRTGGKNFGTRFKKSKTFIVERFMNKLMMPGHKSKKHVRSSGSITGKANTVYGIMEEVLTQIELKTKMNPIEVLVKAIVNASPREEILTIEYGGARYPKAVECGPQRRVDVALRLMTQGSFHKSANSKKSIVSALVDEITNAYSLSPQSNAISKKHEVERQADASR